MLTIFTTPKAFRGHFALIQENAIASWTKLVPKCEIILFGDESDTDSLAKKYNLGLIRNVQKNKNGTPLVSDMFEKIRKVAKNQTLAYVNADIILFDDFMDATKEVKLSSFLIAGQRWDLEVHKKINFNNDWQQKLRQEIKKNGKLHQVGGLDYFVFPKSINFNLPPFAVGRGVWDNWLIYKAKFLKIPVIDATAVITAIHQNHDYSHAGGYDAVWFGQERQRNLQLAKDKKRPFNLVNADWILTRQGIKRPPISLFRLWRNFQVSPLTNPNFFWLTWPPVLMIEFLIKIYRRLKS